MGPESGASNYLSGAKVRWEWKLQCQAKQSLPKISIPHPPLPIEKEYKQEKKWQMKTSHTIIINNIIPIFVFFPFLLF
jgi:hypothetical protein